MPIWMMVAEWSARLIFVLLFLLSVWSIKIMLDRKRFFSDLSNLAEQFWNEAKLDQYKNEATLDRQLDSLLTEKKPEVEKDLSVLGTLGATAPFIGLLGTVLGIIKAFGDLSINSQNTNQIMFSLAEALILTAMGLFVAIPAVVAFNIFQRKVKRLQDLLRLKKNQALLDG